VDTALIAAGGALLGAILTMIANAYNTRTLAKAERGRLELQIEAEQKKVKLQIQAETEARIRERWRDELRETIAQLFSMSEPESAERVDLSDLALLIARAQLMLNPLSPAETKVNDHLNDLWSAAHKYNTSHPNDDGKSRNALYDALSDLMEAVRLLINNQASLRLGASEHTTQQQLQVRV
jgi:hypothetical protein